MIAVDEQLASLLRGAESVYATQELKHKLAEGRPLRIKLGMDPTAPDLHLGHTVVMRKLRQFQDLGHQAILIIGDYTAKIGDPTRRDITRPVLDDATIDANARTYLEQAGRILQTAPDKLQVRRNSEWLSKLSFADVLRLTGQVTVQQMLHRENFKLRMQNEREIVLSEFMYPLMQAYDSVVLEADVELGGTDQTFNNLMGRHLMEKAGLPKQVVMVMPLLIGLDGQEKMSKSKANYVAVMDQPHDMFGKIMSIPDGLMPDYYRLLTGLPEPRISSLLDPTQTHPRDAKDILARVLVEELHDLKAANAASEEFRRRFSQHQLPTDLKQHPASQSPISVHNLLTETGFATSNSDARRLVQQGAVSINDRRIQDPQELISIEGSLILRVGKRRVCQVTAPIA
jgi:tyrosyl-tRNA synthetase